MIPWWKRLIYSLVIVVITGSVCGAIVLSPHFLVKPTGHHTSIGLTETHVGSTRTASYTEGLMRSTGLFQFWLRSYISWSSAACKACGLRTETLPVREAQQEGKR